MRLLLISAFCFLFLASCSSETEFRSAAKIGVDRTWYPLDFGELQPFVNGYVEDLLIEIAKRKNVEFVKMGASWDTLLSGLREKKYDAILCSLPPYSFNQFEFEFSNNFLDIGPVLITQIGRKGDSLAAFKGGLVGTIQGSKANLLLEQDPAVIARTYGTVSDLLQDLKAGNLDAALLEKPEAVSHVNHLYVGALQIASKPLTDAGLHLVTRKGESYGLIGLFNSQLEQKNLQALQKKWNLN